VELPPTAPSSVGLFSVASIMNATVAGRLLQLRHAWRMPCWTTCRQPAVKNQRVQYPPVEGLAQVEFVFVGPFSSPRGRRFKSAVADASLRAQRAATSAGREVPGRSPVELCALRGNTGTHGTA
jgi:hypothetical protein